jgi:hypothetical protein
MDPARSASGREGVLYRPRVMVRGLTQVHNYLELRAAVFWRTCETLPLLGFRDIILVMVTRYGLENGLDNETGTPLAKVRGGGGAHPMICTAWALSWYFACGPLPDSRMKCNDDLQFSKFVYIRIFLFQLRAWFHVKAIVQNIMPLRGSVIRWDV